MAAKPDQPPGSSDARARRAYAGRGRCQSSRHGRPSPPSARAAPASAQARSRASQVSATTAAGRARAAPSAAGDEPDQERSARPGRQVDVRVDRHVVGVAVPAPAEIPSKSMQLQARSGTSCGVPEDSALGDRAADSRSTAPIPAGVVGLPNWRSRSSGPQPANGLSAVVARAAARSRRRTPWQTLDACL